MNDMQAFDILFLRISFNETFKKKTHITITVTTKNDQIAASCSPNEKWPKIKRSKCYKSNKNEAHNLMNRNEHRCFSFVVRFVFCCYFFFFFRHKFVEMVHLNVRGNNGPQQHIIMHFVNESDRSNECGSHLVHGYLSNNCNKQRN